LGFEARLQELGFDYTYDKRLYDKAASRDARAAVEYLEELSPQFIFRSVHFLENHDEPRIAPLLPFAKHRAALLLTLALPGMRLLHQGQLDGASAQTSVHLRRRLSEPANPQTAVGNGRSLIVRPQPAWAGNESHRNFVLVQWQREAGTFDLAVVNLSADRSQCHAPLAIDDLASHHWRLADLLGTEIHERSGPDLLKLGLFLDVPPHAAHLFHFSSIGKL